MSPERAKSMDCGDCLERLYAFLEEDLAPEERAAMGAHLGDCLHCLDELDSVRRRDAFMTKVRECCGSDVAPASLRDRIARLLPPR